MTGPDDMTLVREYADQKSDAAFEALVRRHVNLVYSAALRQARNPSLAEEITQATFIILARKAGAFRPGTILPVWLLRTVRHAARTELRATMRRQRHETEAQMESMIQTEVPTQPEWEQIAPLLDEALARLGEKERSALVLRYFNEKPFDEVGAALGIDAATARKRVERGLEKLRHNFAKRGVALSVGVVAAVLPANAVQAAPAGLIISAAAIKGAAVSVSTTTLIKGTLKLMAWTKLKIAVVAGVAVVLAAGTATVVVQEHSTRGPGAEPAYAGRPLSDWLRDIDSGQPQDKREQAADAFRHMGARTLPFLLDDLFPQQPSRHGTIPPGGKRSETEMREASWAFKALGPIAKPAMPELFANLERTAGYAPLALAGVGADAIPYLIRALTNQDVAVRINTAVGLGNAVSDGSIPKSSAAAAVPQLVNNLRGTNSAVRGNAAGALGVIVLQPDLSVPALTEALGDPDEYVRAAAADALRGFGDQAASAVPKLRELFQDKGPRAQSAALWAVARIAPADPALLPLLIQELHDSEPWRRWNSLNSLSAMGAAAESAVPEVVKATQDTNAGVDIMARIALNKIDPQAASQAGVK